MKDNQMIYSVKELTRIIKKNLEYEPLLQNIWVRGEISNFIHHSSGHMYFTLKDKDSRVKCVMFASHNQKLPFIPRNGTKVLARGNISLYERDGQYQLYINQMQPDGIGSLYLAFEQLKQKLEKEGLFSPEKKKKLPLYAKTVGVVTSPTGAAVRDIVTTIQRRNPSVSILLYPVSVQGKNAVPSIQKGIQVLNKYEEIDVIIVGRGGGSLEELWAFNEEIVARSISESRIPVISAVGHETDYTISDFVADVRAATPTAAAELAVPHHLEIQNHLDHLKQRLNQAVYYHLQKKAEKLERLKRSSYLRSPHKQLVQPTERLDRLKEQLNYKMLNRVSSSREKLSKIEAGLSTSNLKNKFDYSNHRVNNMQRRLDHTIKAYMKNQKLKLSANVKQLDALSPLKVMHRGYSLVFNEEEQMIKSVHQTQIGDQINIKLMDGILDCKVKMIKEEK
ncbi:exodeoxyribonuclease VII large subunit [Chengkuizengella axinellae]|uniref:Exodeoxyribonuclease 7 large subunit n=1 Tax=Chengkuizengella axinellae TaxID=3064388 RepID=A0ABT9IW69_9BACL|nr:exodeoxyribonuclease VII large subunit [Chengkuizengella sp. 2205SS18-9]MDP5273606.1 exodeoxyribonuclease VII large subunit [Chengkuizengella sp. 2205SS18-9]